MSKIYLNMNAWREILARTFDGTLLQQNVSPSWLINPATRRKLKLDCYYPDINIAVRFVGITAKGQPRQSDWDHLETQQRDEARAELCQQNGVQLATIDPAGDPSKQMASLLRTISKASRVLAQSEVEASEKQIKMPFLSKAQRSGEELRRLINKQPDQMMANLAEGWRDREAGMIQQAQSEDFMAAHKANKLELPPPKLVVNERVSHVKFGDGVITKVDGSDDPMITILFDGSDERTFLASLVEGKLGQLSGS